MAGKHGTPARPVIDPLAAYLTLLVAFLRLTARLVLRELKPPRREVRWPTGADEEWAEWLHVVNATDPVVRQEVRA